jgi:putative ABC transport system permease protein
MVLLLPSGFRRAFADELMQTVRDRQRESLMQASRLAKIRFWGREFAGLLATAFRERVEPLHRRRTTPNRQVNPPTPKRERGMFGFLKQDLIFAFRMIVKTPVVTAIAVISLSIGVAANTTVFSLVHSWLLRPLPYPNPDQLVMVWENELLEEGDQRLVAPANFFDWRAGTKSLSDWIASEFETVSLTGLEQPEQLTVARVTANYFSVLGADPMLGRVFRAEEGGAEDTPVVVMSQTLWQTRFGESVDVVGSSVVLNGARYTVVGVMPEAFDFLLGNVSMWIASDFLHQRYVRDNRSMLVSARMAPGATVDQSQAEMAALASRLAELHPEANRNVGANVETVRDQFPGPTDRGLIQILLTVVALVLLTACVNVSNLLMAKTDARQREIGVRVALGAGRSRLLSQLLTESILLALIAGILGTVLSYWGIKAVAQAMPVEMPEFLQPRLEGAPIAFGIGVSVLAGLAFGIAPAMQAVSGGLSSPLVDGDRGGTGTKKKQRLRGAFVMAEFALALTILMGATVLTDLFHQRLDIDPGFIAGNLLKAELTLPAHKYEDDEAVLAFIGDVERQLETIPSTVGFALSNVLPRARAVPSAEFTIDGREYEPDELPSSWWLSVSPAYFDVMGIELRAGRTFVTADRADAPPVIVVSQRMVTQFFDGENPVGQRITMSGESREIIGVVNNIAQSRLTGLLPQQATVYFPLEQRPVRALNIVVRGEGDAGQLALPLQSAVWAVDRDQPISRVSTLETHIRTVLAGPTVMTQILVVVGVLTLVLAGIGIYGVMAYSVTQRTREIGIRMALGASRGQVLTRVVRQGATLAGGGLLLGTPLAVAALMTLTSIFERTAVEDGLQASSSVVAFSPVALVAAILIGVGLIACYLPARRATKVDPVEALQLV